LGAAFFWFILILIFGDCYSHLALKEYNAAHEPTHIYWKFCRSYIDGFAADVGYWGNQD
jgi:hypothetical protein